MMHYFKHPLAMMVSLMGVFLLTFLVPAAVADRDDEYQEYHSSARVSERDQRSFDTFLDAHWETAQELYRDPTLINNDRFLRGHQDLRDWLEDHQEAAKAIQADPRAAIWHERTAGRREEERQSTSARMSERDLRSFEDYLNAHDETAQALYQNPDLINDRQFVRRHDALHDWLEDHKEAAAAIEANPHKFLWRERAGSPSDFLRQFLK